MLIRICNDRKTKAREAKKRAETVAKGPESHVTAFQPSMVAKPLSSDKCKKTVDVKGIDSTGANVETQIDTGAIAWRRTA
jgi:hypothetical protein